MHFTYRNSEFIVTTRNVIGELIEHTFKLSLVTNQDIELHENDYCQQEGYQANTKKLRISKNCSFIFRWSTWIFIMTFWCGLRMTQVKMNITWFEDIKKKCIFCISDCQTLSEFVYFNVTNTLSLNLKFFDQNFDIFFINLNFYKNFLSLLIFGT